jgi:hypothetical protein
MYFFICYYLLETILKKIGPGQVLGEREFAMHSTHDHNCRTVTFT